MVKLIALYRRPQDPEAFDAHYLGIHTPLVKQMPGLKKLEVTRIDRIPGGQASPYYLLAEMSFEDERALDHAMRSPAGRAAARDLGEFASAYVEMYVGRTDTMTN